MESKYKKIYFVGIGGIGVSAAARIMLDQGIEVCGSDVSDTDIIEDLKKLGATITLGHKKENVESDVDALVYSLAAKNSPEVEAGKKMGIDVYAYSEFISEISKNRKQICISGTHGKTTTTALAGKVLLEANLDPTIVIGSNVDYLNGNGRLGKGDYFLLEADEYCRVFKNYHPKIAIVTTIDFDHPDCYKDLDDVKDAFNDFLTKVSEDGIIIANRDDENVLDVVSKVNKDIIWYGLDSEDVDVKGDLIRIDDLSTFNVKSKLGNIKDIKLQVHGKHNIQNSLAIISLGLYLKIEPKVIKEALQKFVGAWRRFEIKAIKNGITVVDDYAHHPAELKALLDSARSKYPNQRIVTVFQPHHQERTKALFNDFAPALAGSDLVILTDIYKVPGRSVDLDLDLNLIVEDIKKDGSEGLFVEKLEDIPLKLKEILREGDVVLVVGAGDVNMITDDIIDLL